MNLIILGPQGSGKGTQASLLAKEFKLFYYDNGRYLRKVAKNDPKIDRLINKEGKLLSDKLVISLATDYIEKHSSSRDNLLLDGLPRSVKQYEMLSKWLAETEKEIDYAVLLEISEEESIKRLSARRICEECGEIYNLITNPPLKNGCKCGGELIQRKDDKPEAIRQRLKLYHQTTEPLIKIYEREGVLVRVDGERPIDVIFEDIMSQLRKKNLS